VSQVRVPRDNNTRENRLHTIAVVLPPFLSRYRHGVTAVHRATNTPVPVMGGRPRRRRRRPHDGQR